MQILLNLGVVGQAVIEHMRNRIVLEEGETIHVELTDDGATVFVLPEGETPEGNDDGSPSSTAEKPAKKPRRSKAQIEADNKAEAERKAEADLAAAGGTQGNAVASTDKPVVEAASAVVEAAGETTPEVSGDGEATSETAADPIVETPVVVEEAKPEVVAEAEPDLTPEVEPERKPTTSLFANLRKPNNQ